MPESETTIHRLIESLIERRGEGAIAISPGSRLFEDLDMDSLEVAELSAALEDELGNDPFSLGVVPSTVDELVAFYRS